MHNDPWSPGCLCPSLILSLQDENEAAASANSRPPPPETVGSAFVERPLKAKSPNLAKSLYLICNKTSRSWANVDWISGSKWLICLVSGMNYWTYVTKLTQLWGKVSPEFFCKVTCFQMNYLGIYPQEKVSDSSQNAKQFYGYFPVIMVKTARSNLALYHFSYYLMPSSVKTWHIVLKMQLISLIQRILLQRPINKCFYRMCKLLRLSLSVFIGVENKFQTYDNPHTLPQDWWESERLIPTVNTQISE